MIVGFTVLLLCQLAGEVVVRSLALPLPGPVLGMAFLVAGLWLHARLTIAPTPDAADAQAPVGRAADALLAMLSLLFVPAGVGVVRHLETIGANAVAIVVSLIASTVVTMIVTVGTYRLVKVYLTKGEGEP